MLYPDELIRERSGKQRPRALSRLVGATTGSQDARRRNAKQIENKFQHAATSKISTWPLLPRRETERAIKRQLAE